MKGHDVLDDWQVDPWDDPMELYEFEAERPRRGWRGVRWLVYGFFVCLVAGLLIAGAVGMWVVRQVNPPGTPGERINFTVSEGDTLESVAARLQAQGIITSKRVFEAYAERKGGLEPRAGYYTVQPRADMGDLLSVLRTPPAQTYEKVTFPEGFTLDQIAARLANRLPRMTTTKVKAAATDGTVRSKYQPEGQPSLEGLLFPDTYQVAGNETETDVVARMVKLMERIGAREGLDDAVATIGLTPYQVLIIASMIEREAKVAEDRPLIARVILNRIFLNMPLQIDATLFYGQDPDRPFSELRELPSPYNTYLNLGLPPTPIAAPGRASIRAALDPTANPDPEDCPGQADKKKPEPCAYLYYVLADTEGRHAFATNLADHERNVAKARAAGLLG